MTITKGRSAFSLWFAGETVSQLGTSLAMLGWTLLVLPVTLVLGLPLVGLVYLGAGLRDSRTRRRGPAVAR